MKRNDWPETLLAWFDGSRRALPWREEHPRNPYHVWVSEIMLQQTRTETVKGYFQRWMEQFPTIRDLAQAPEEQVLRAWQGLGYYSRARNLHKAARQVMAEWGGQLPRERKALGSLAGIGAYTVGAILSMAFGEKIPAVDGNLLRVLSRLYGVEEDISGTQGKKTITALAEEAIPGNRPGDFNEALMDLGAEVCIPRHPRCEACPLTAFCQAWKEGKTEILPVKKPKAPQEGTGCGLRTGGPGGSVSVPQAAGQRDAGLHVGISHGSDRKKEESIPALEYLTGGDAGQSVWRHKHIFTHRIWDMTAYMVSRGESVPEGSDWCWQSPEKWEKIL